MNKGIIYKIESKNRDKIGIMPRKIVIMKPKITRVIPPPIVCDKCGSKIKSCKKSKK